MRDHFVFLALADNDQAGPIPEAQMPSWRVFQVRELARRALFWEGTYVGPSEVRKWRILAYQSLEGASCKQRGYS